MAMLLVNFPGDHAYVYEALRHSAWNGFTAADLVFPAFLFIMGASVALSPRGGIETAGDRSKAAGRIMGRAARLIGLALGLTLLSYLLTDDPTFRLWGVLQRIGVCYAAVGLLSLYASARSQWMTIVGILVGYSILLVGFGGVSLEGNPASRLDTALFGPLLRQYDPTTGIGHDPEGLVSTFPAIATALLGYRAGVWLRERRTRRLVGWSVGLTVIGVLWSLVLPLNKNLWTPSFAVFTAGLSIMIMVVAHGLIDRKSWPALAEDFGRNAIVAYIGSEFLAEALYLAGLWAPAYRHGFEWMAPMTGGELPSLLFAVAYVLVWAGILRFMAWRGWRVRI